jgi:hypothetical protein
MLGEVISLATVRVDALRSAEWERAYDEYARAFVAEVPGGAGASLWRGALGRVADERTDASDGIAIFEHARLDDLARSRRYRAGPAWAHRVAALAPLHAAARDQSTIDLQRLSARGQEREVRAVLATTWSIEGPRVPSFEAFYRAAITGDFASTLPGLVAVSRYVALLAELHGRRADGAQVGAPQRHHFEGRKDRLVYATLFELAELPAPGAQERALGDLDAVLRPHAGLLADRVEIFAGLIRSYEQTVPASGTVGLAVAGAR